MKGVELDLIIVSPMRRALTTCALVFKDHPSHPPVIVDPLFREILESGCDIGSRLRFSMKDYPDFDYSLIHNVDDWYIETMSDYQTRK
jgi:broad specificity phosphatase PhoE